MSKVEDFIVEADPLMRDLLEARREVYDAEGALSDGGVLAILRGDDGNTAAKTRLAAAWRAEYIALERWLHKDE